MKKNIKINKLIKETKQNKKKIQVKHTKSVLLIPCCKQKTNQEVIKKNGLVILVIIGVVWGGPIITIWYHGINDVLKGIPASPSTQAAMESVLERLQTPADEPIKKKQSLLENIEEEALHNNETSSDTSSNTDDEDDGETLQEFAHNFFGIVNNIQNYQKVVAWNAFKLYPSLQTKNRLDTIIKLHQDSTTVELTRGMIIVTYNSREFQDLKKAAENAPDAIDGKGLRDYLDQTTPIRLALLSPEVFLSAVYCCLTIINSKFSLVFLSYIFIYLIHSRFKKRKNEQKNKTTTKI